MSAVQHTHPGDQLTFGCDACVAARRDSMWAAADWREVTWVFIADVPGHGRRQIDCATTRRVLDGADPWDVDERYILDTGALLSIRLLEQFPKLTADDVVKACLESECVDVKIGKVVPPVPMPDQTVPLF